MGAKRYAPSDDLQIAGFSLDRPYGVDGDARSVHVRDGGVVEREHH